jgi:hypothetical protein
MNSSIEVGVFAAKTNLNKLVQSAFFSATKK